MNDWKLIRKLLFLPALLLLPSKSVAYTIDGLVGDNEKYICNGESNPSLSITTSSYENRNYKFAWKVDGNVYAGTTLPNLYAYNGKTIELMVTDDYGRTETKQIKVKQDGNASVQIKQPSQKFCKGQPLELSVNNPEKGVEYHWTLKDEKPAAGKEPFEGSGSSTNVEKGGTYVVTAIRNGCSYTSEMYVKEPSGITLSGNDGLCAGGSLNVTANGMDNYIWSTGAEGNTAHITSSGQNYYVAGSTRDGCVDTARFEVNSKDQIKIDLDGVTALCPGADGTTLTAKATDGSSTMTYTWLGGNGKPIGKDNTITIKEPGEYTIKVNSSNGCSGQRNFPITSVDVIGNIEINGKTEICEGSSTILGLSGTNLTKFYLEDGLLLEEIPAQGLTLKKGGDYVIIGKTKDGCPSESVSINVKENKNPQLNIENVFPCEGDGEQILKAFYEYGNDDYVFYWNDDDFTEKKAIKVKESGTYSATLVNKVTKCITESSATVEYLAYPEVDIEGVLSFCTGQSTRLVATIKGPKIVKSSYKWIGPDGKDVAVGDSVLVVDKPGTYTFIAKNEHGCETKEDVTVVEKTAPEVDVKKSAEYLCDGEKVTFTAAGTGIKQYSWSKDNKQLGSGSELVVDAAGTYKLTVTSDNGCAVIKDVTIGTRSKMTLTTQMDTICEGGSGKLTVSVSDAKAQIVWEDGSASGTRTVSATGTYTATVTDDAGCSQTISFNVEVRSLPTPKIDKGVVNGCKGKKTYIEASVSNIRSSYGWGLLTEAGTQVVENGTNGIYVKEPGKYVFTEISAYKCQASDTVEVVMNEPPVVKLTAPANHCGSEVLKVTASGADEYSWMDYGDFVADNSFSQKVQAGRFSVSVVGKNTATGCTSEKVRQTVVIDAPIELAISGALSICEGETSDVSVSGATSYVWKKGADVVSNSATYTLKAEGSYTIEASNPGSACKADTAFTVKQEALPMVSARDTFFCEGGPDVEVAVSGGESYKWTDGDGKEYGPATVVTVSKSGQYQVVGYSPMGCASKPVSVNARLQEIKAAIGGDEVLCANGSAQLKAEAVGKAPFSYSWNGGDFGTDGTYKITQDGMHELRVRDSFGCEAAATKVFEFSTPAITIEGPTEFCADSAVTFKASGEAEKFYWNQAKNDSKTFSTDTEGTYNVMGVDKNGCKGYAETTLTKRSVPEITIADTVLFCEGGSSLAEATLNRKASGYLWNGSSSLSSSSTFEVSKEGDYKVMGYDDLMCPSATVSFHAKEVKLPVVSISGQNYVCEGGESITLTATTDNGVTFLWNNGSTKPAIEVAVGGTYSVTTGIGNCTSKQATFVVEQKKRPAVSVAEGSNVTFCDLDSLLLHASSPTAVQFAWFSEEGGADTLAQTSEYLLKEEGAFTVKVADAFGCENQTQVEAVTIKGPNVKIEGETDICQYEHTVLTAVCPTCDGLQWNTGDKTNSITVDTSGLYTVVGYNSSGCPSKPAQHQLTVHPAPWLTIKGKTDITSNDTAFLTADVVGKEPFTFHWSPKNEITKDIVVPGSELQPGASTLYSVMVTDSNGCYNFAITKVTLHSVSVKGKTDICDGETSLLTVFGIGAESYKWNTGETTPSINVAHAGTYKVITSFDNGLVDTVAIDVTVHDSPEVAIAGANAFCVGDSAVLTVDGVDIDKIIWNTGHADSSIVVREGGKYRVDVTSAYGCTSADSVEVTAHPLPDVAIVGQDSILEGTTTIWEATGANTYRWDRPDSLTTNMLVSEPGRYHVVGTDANGCTNVTYKDLYIIPIPLPLINDTANAVLYACEGDTFTLIASGAETYTWDTGETTDRIKVTESRVYVVTGCLANSQCRETSVSVEFSPRPKMMKVDGETMFCPGASSVLTAHTFDDNLIDHFVWNTGEFTPQKEVAHEGEYSVYAISNYGCHSDTSSVEVAHFPTPVIGFEGMQEVCDGNATHIAATGGVRYEWPNDNVNTDKIEVTTAGEHIVRVWNEYGCAADSFVYIRDLGTPEITIGGKAYFCEGGQTELAVQGAYFTKNYVTWSTGETLNTIVVDKPGVYEASVTNNSGCMATATIDVVALPNPTIAIDGPAQLCIGDTIALAGKQLGGNEITDYQWSTGLHSPSVRVHEPGTYTLQATDVNGCRSNVAEKTLEVKIPNPVSVSGDFDLCVEREDEALVTAASTGAVFYRWLSANKQDTLAASTDATHGFLTAGTYMVEAVDANYCVSRTDVVIRGRKNPNVEILGAEIPVCGVEVATLNAQTDPNVDFTWGGGEKTTTITADSSGTFTLYGVDEWGCYSSDTAELILNDIPDMATSEDFSFCPGQSTNVTVSGAQNYLWSNGETGDFATFGTATEAFVVGTDRYGCQKRINFTISEFHVPDVLLVASPTKIERNDSRVNFDVTSAESLDSCLFFWQLGDDEEETAKRFEHEYSVTNQRRFNVSLVVTTADGCETTKQVTISCDLDIPNTITPNGDGVNDVFMKGCRVWIYDRHGVLLHDGHDGWDGKLPNGDITPDTYYYVLQDITGEIFYGYVTVK